MSEVATCTTADIKRLQNQIDKLWEEIRAIRNQLNR
jgi:hypothetical protein